MRSILRASHLQRASAAVAISVAGFFSAACSSELGNPGDQPGVGGGGNAANGGGGGTANSGNGGTAAGGTGGTTGGSSTGGAGTGGTSTGGATAGNTSGNSAAGADQRARRSFGRLKRSDEMAPLVIPRQEAPVRLRTRPYRHREW